MYTVNTPTMQLSTVSSRAFPSARREHGTVCHPMWRNQMSCKPSKPN